MSTTSAVPLTRADHVCDILASVGVEILDSQKCIKEMASKQRWFRLRHREWGRYGHRWEPRDLMHDGTTYVVNAAMVPTEVQDDLGKILDTGEVGAEEVCTLVFVKDPYIAVYCGPRTSYRYESVGHPKTLNPEDWVFFGKWG